MSWVKRIDRLYEARDQFNHWRMWHGPRRQWEYDAALQPAGRWVVWGRVKVRYDR